MQVQALGRGFARALRKFKRLAAATWSGKQK
jgi:hypothetical protein